HSLRRSQDEVRSTHLRRAGCLRACSRRGARGDVQRVLLSRDPRCVGGAQLQPVETATSLRVQDGRSLTTDGPFADTKEVFGGYYVFDVPDLDDALELAARIPAARLGGSVEVRPVLERP